MFSSDPSAPACRRCESDRRTAQTGDAALNSNSTGGNGKSSPESGRTLFARTRATGSLLSSGALLFSPPLSGQNTPCFSIKRQIQTLKVPGSRAVCRHDRIAPASRAVDPGPVQAAGGLIIVRRAYLHPQGSPGRLNTPGHRVQAWPRPGPHLRVRPTAVEGTDRPQ